MSTWLNVSAPLFDDYLKRWRGWRCTIQFDMQIDHKDTHVPEITNSIEQCHPWESYVAWASKEIPRVLWAPEVHCRIHNSPPPLPVLSQSNWIHAAPSHFLEIYFNITLPSTTRSPKFSVPFIFSRQKPYSLLLSSPAYHIPRPSHSSRFDHPNSSWWGIQIVKLLIM